MIKHISFDLWGTLIKSNPQYKQEKAKILAKELLEEYRVPYTVEQCLAAIHYVGRSYDHMVELWGISLHPVQLIHQLVGHVTGMANPDLVFLIRLEILFIDQFVVQSPFLYDENTLPILEELKSKGYTLSIASNTGFIDGEIMRTILKKLEIYDLFDFMIFSNEKEVSKPNVYFWDSIWCAVDEDIKKSEILHIGNDPIADHSFGIPYAIINSNDKTILDVLKLVENEQKYVFSPPY